MGVRAVTPNVEVEGEGCAAHERGGSMSAAEEPRAPRGRRAARTTSQSIELAPSPGRVLVGDRGGDVLLELAGSAFAEVDVHDVVVEGRDGGDEAAAVGVDDLGGLAVA